jgi:threonine dehydrogenase-like Zn-dependent dehydrogenase
VFLINVPIALLGLVFAIPLVPNSLDPNAQRPDAFGALLSVAGLGLALWAVIEAPVHGWTSALVLGTGATGLLTLALFVAWEAHSKHPMAADAGPRSLPYVSWVGCDRRASDGRARERGREAA